MMSRTFLRYAVCCLIASKAWAANDVVLTEFMASNSRTLADEGGVYPDWIEIHNTTFTNINLEGWALTDSSGNLTKWRFPATNIVAGGYMIIFADGQDKRTPGAPLHTSFSLKASGDFLALVRPDHSIATQFSAIQQLPDVSYGFGMLSTNWNLVTTNAPLRVRIPADASAGSAWTQPGYNDSTWTAGTNGVGYASSNSALADYGAVVLPMQPVAYWRMDESSGTASPNRGTLGSSANLTYSGATLGTAGPRPPAFGGFEGNNNAPTFNGSSGYATAGSSLLSAHNTFTMCGWIKLSSAPADRTGLFGQNDCVEFGFSTAANIQCWTPNGAANLAWTPPVGVWIHILAACDGTTLRLYTNGVLASSGASTANATSSSAFNIGGNGVFDASGNFFPGQIDEVAVFYRALNQTEITALYQGGVTPSAIPLTTLIKTDVGPAMSNVNSSAYIRIPFTVTDTNNVALLTLRARYNDGFVAYINGTEVARANAVDPLSYNSAATTNHDVSSTTDYRFNATMITNGANILAIQGLNVASTDIDFFINAELIATSPAVQSTTPVYFTKPTPGADNVGGIANPGPAILDPGHTPNVPADNQDITVTANIVSTFYPAASVVLRYRVMFNNELEVPMFDDGQHGDGATNDGIFGATIPVASASTNGEMIRWYIRATDTQGNISRWPLFTDPADSEEYLGTIVDPGTNVASKLPVIHLFAPTSILQPGPTTTQTGADSQAGGRVSVFYDGEFYDNIEFNLRGNSTAGFNKKSHHVNFNTEHPFRPPFGRARVRHTSFEADYPDPAYMRQFLSFWLAEQMGIPAAYYDPVRLQLNSQFYQLASHNNVVGAEQIEWMGLDPNGALYKAAGVVATSQYSTGNFEKKTRLFENNADYQAFAAAIAESNPVATRRTNAFEMFNIPAVLDYLVTARWAHENDDVWANMTLYRDTLGDGRWRVIPFDMNLSWGAIFYEGSTPAVIEGVQATNDIHKAHPLYGSSSCVALSGPGSPNNFNRVYDTFFQVPELRQMFLRRMRTLLDTWVKPIGTPTNSTVVEQLILARRDLVAEEANRDRAKWSWPPKGGQCNFDPGINITNGVNQLLAQFFIARRNHLYGKHSVTNTALAIGIGNGNNAGIPLAQPTNAVIQIAGFDFNPSSGNQGHEYIAITNPNPYTLDISGWKLDSAVKFTFPPGTIMISNSVLYLTPDIKAFRTRTATPKSGQGLFVLGNYDGQLTARGETLVVKDDAGRIVATNSYAGNPSLPQQYLRVTEVMYHPGPTNGLSALYPQEDYEYIELKNIGPVSVNLVGVHFTNGISFVFTATNIVTSLAAGQSVVLVKNPSAFVARYGSGTAIAGIYSGNLENAGERLQLHDAVGEEILDFTYNNSWYPITDGLGFSLVIVDETAPFNTWNNKSSWRPSGRINGSPGANDPAPAVLDTVLVNEVLSASVLPNVDAIELWNPTTNTVAVGNWYVSDDFFTPKKYRIPAGTTIAPGGYLVIDEHAFNSNPALPTSFAFSSKGDEAYLFAGDASGNLLGYYHGFDFGAADDGVTFGRYVNSQGEELFVSQASPTLGSANAGPKVGPVVISEIMYHPPDLNGSDDSDNEYIELRNISSNSVALYDTAAPTNRWKLKDGVDFHFSTNTVLEPGAFLLVVSFDPATNASALAAFRARYGLDSNAPIVGPYSGKLDNSANHVELAHPQPVTTNGFEYVLSDKVDYMDTAPWSAAADGSGGSLQRIVPGAFGNDPTNWVAAAPSPAAPLPGGTPPAITNQPSGGLYVEGSTVILSVGASGDAPLKYQWLRNNAAIAGATGASLTLTNAQVGASGDYSVAIFNGAGAAISSNATLVIRALPQFVVAPVDQTVLPGSNVTFSAVVSGTAPIQYQWRFNSADITGATNASLSISNIELYTHAGYYSVAVRDAVGSITSGPAALFVNVKPVITNPPVSVSVVQGGTAIFTVIAGPVHPFLPITYRWVSTVGTPNNLSNGVMFVTNVQGTSSIRLSVVNPFGQTNITGGVTLTMLPDFDHDGIADAWEVQYGFNTNSVADAALDSDGDGMSNHDEYIAGTNPLDPTSVLRLTQSGENKSVLGFTAQTNVSYTIQTRTNLTSAPWQNWTNIFAIAGQARNIQFQAVTNDLRFYRVMTPQVLQP